MRDIPPSKLDPDFSDFDFTTFETAIARVRAEWLDATKLAAFDLFAEESFEKSMPEDSQLDKIVKLRQTYEELLAAYSEMKKLLDRNRQVRDDA